MMRADLLREYVKLSNNFSAIPLVQSSREKHSASRFPQITPITPAILSHQGA
jgi:hypothetical protein